MRKLLFDLVATQPNASGKRHGGGKYGEIIFFRMIERGFQFDCLYNSRIWLNPDVENAAKQHGCKMHDVAQSSIETIVEKDCYEAIYSCLPSKEILKINYCKVICTLHGLRKLETPEDNYFWKYPSDFKSKVKWIINKYAKIIWRKKLYKDYSLFLESDCSLITMSEHSMAAIKSYFPNFKKDSFEIFNDFKMKCFE